MQTKCLETLHDSRILHITLGDIDKQTTIIFRQLPRRPVPVLNMRYTELSAFLHSSIPLLCSRRESKNSFLQVTDLFIRAPQRFTTNLALRAE